VGAEVKTKEKIAFTSEIQQAGIFTITALPEEELRYTLHAFCPNLLYMYARELLADFVQKAGFPQLNLAPVDFESMHQQELKKKLAESA
jgi:preprotein translocase subunit SecB